MKKSIILVVMLAAAMVGSAQSNILNLSHEWLKMVGYSYQPGYPYGFSLAGGSFLSMGFAEDGKRYDISATEYREPTWAFGGQDGTIPEVGAHIRVGLSVTDELSILNGYKRRSF